MAILRFFCIILDSGSFLLVFRDEHSIEGEPSMKVNHLLIMECSTDDHQLYTGHILYGVFNSFFPNSTHFEATKWHVIRAEC
jgi:hypothetical protein